MKVRLIREIGTRAWLRTFVFPGVDSCPEHHAGRHEALNFLTDSGTVRDWTLGGDHRDHATFAWPSHCDSCGVDMTRMEHHKAIFHRRLYDTASGFAGPGDMYYADWYHQPGKGCLYGWSGCTEPHLVVILPNGRHWDIDGRCTNCTARTDLHHRCWIRHGNPPLITVNKQGLTCSVGNGSVVAGSWRGYLTNGLLRPIKDD